MNPNNIPQNRLPNYLASIPTGQIFILTNPAHGLTAKHIVLMEFIYSMAGQWKEAQLCTLVIHKFEGTFVSYGYCFYIKLEYHNNVADTKIENL